jgi:hypothetical protein
MNKEETKSLTNAWMPVKEAIAYQEWMSRMDEEQLAQHRYFMWNNFSLDGWEEYKEKHMLYYKGESK